MARFPGPHDSVCAARAQASAHLGSASRTQECFHTHKSASMGPRRARTTRATRTHERMSTSTCIVSAHAYGYARAHAGMTQAHVRCANVRPRCRRRRHDEAADSARVCAGKLQQRAACGCTASDRAALYSPVERSDALRGGCERVQKSCGRGSRSESHTERRRAKQWPSLLRALPGSHALGRPLRSLLVAAHVRAPSARRRETSSMVVAAQRRWRDS